MPHIVKVVEQKELNDEHVGYRFRCCDDASTDSWCTVSLHLSGVDLTEAVNGHRLAMATRHEHKNNFRNGTHAVLAVVSDATIHL
jgi:hypothetical protein